MEIIWGFYHLKDAIYFVYSFFKEKTSSENHQNTLIKNIGKTNISKSINSQKMVSELKFYENRWS